MRLVFQPYCVPKEGYALDECEDAWAADASAGRFAVADGASEDFGADVWARLVAEGFIRQRSPWPEWLAPIQEHWQAQFSAQALSWYAETKFLEGAFATLLGVVVDDQGWQALAIGDSCLFHVHAEQLVRAFPLETAASFSNRLELLGSRAAADAAPSFHAEGVWRQDDHLFLMSDALAHWFLQESEAAAKPWQILLELPDPLAFADYIGRLRASHALRDDDVTLLHLAYA